MDPITMGLISAGGGLLSSTIGDLFGSAANSSSQDFAMQQQSQAEQYNTQMWNATNQYNSPAAQMQRLTDAGLNPNLVYGVGAGGNVAQLPPSAPQAHYVAQPLQTPSNVGADFVNAYTNTAAQQAQSNNANAQASLAAQTAALTAQEVFNNYGGHLANLVTAEADKNTSESGLNMMAQAFYPDVTRAKINADNAQALFQTGENNRAQLLFPDVDKEIQSRSYLQNTNALLNQQEIGSHNAGFGNDWSRIISNPFYQIFGGTNPNTGSYTPSVLGHHFVLGNN